MDDPGAPADRGDDPETRRHRLLDGLKARASALKREVVALYYAYRDPRSPLASKAVMLLTLGYALSPVDLIPDFIPVLGYLDDLVILPALVALSLRLLPPEVMADARRRAAEEPLRLERNWVAAIVILAVWACVAAGLVKAISGK